MNMPIALQRKDSIIIPMEKVEGLFQWRNNNTELVHGFTPILEDVVVRVGNIFIHVEVSPDPEFSYRFTVFDNDHKVLVQDWNRHTMIGNISYNRLPAHIIKDSMQAKDYAQSVISVYCTMMAYMEHYKEVVTRQDVSTRKVKDRKKKGGKGKKVTYLRSTIYTVSGDFRTEKETNSTGENKRGYTVPSEPFKVRGHWRTYKNGNKVWVAGFTKNADKGVPEPTTYKL